MTSPAPSTSTAPPAFLSPQHIAIRRYRAAHPATSTRAQPFCPSQPRPSPPQTPRHARPPVAPPVALAAGKGANARKNLSPTIINRQARFRYELLDTYECGIELLGTEIKSVRTGSLALRDGFARVKDGELFLHNVNIAAWTQATNFFNHDPLRVRRLLLHKRSIRKLAGKQSDPGLTLIPTRAYFAKNGYLKIEIALCRGKQLHDRRQDIKKREDDRNLRRVTKATVSGL